MARVDLNKHYVRDLAPVSKENKRCTSQQTRNTIVELLHRRPLADLVKLANFTVKRVNLSFLLWELHRHVLLRSRENKTCIFITRLTLQ